MRRAPLLAIVAPLALAALAVIGALGAAPAEAQRPPPIELRVGVEPRVVTLGDRVRITVIVTHTEALLITADPPSRSEAMQLIEALPAETVTLPDGSLQTEIAFTVAAFALGPHDPGPLRIFWLSQDGNSGEVQAIPPAFEVTSALLDDSGALRPLKPQAAFGEPPPAWMRPAIAGGVLLGLILVVALGVRWLRRRTPAAAPPAERLERTPETAARRRLEELASSGALSGGDYEHFYGTLSVVLRDYLEARFEFNATALTTPELDRSMGGYGVERWPARLAGGLLDRCDAAVYAGRRPDPGSADHDLTVAFEIIDLSRTRTPVTARPPPAPRRQGRRDDLRQPVAAAAAPGRGPPCCWRARWSNRAVHGSPSPASPRCARPPRRAGGCGCAGCPGCCAQPRSRC